MKNYLELIPVSAKIHRRQTRMTRWCIVISVFLISVIFGMADMFLQSQKNLAIMIDGAWHVAFRELDAEQMAFLSARPEVKTVTRYAAANYKLNMDYEVGGVQTVLCGFDETFFEIYPAAGLLEGSFPKGTEEALVSEGMRNRLGLGIGDEVEMTTPGGSLSFRISGFVEDTSMMLKTDAFGLFVNTDTYLSCFREATLREDFVCYVEFLPHCRIQKAIRDICGQLHIPEDKVSENARLMGTLMQSSDHYILMLYLIAFLLAVLVAVSGMMMILGSMNSNVAQRTEFFGMMRCLGATGKQVRRYVRMEAAFWCLKAIPPGLFASVLTVWGLCRMLKVITPTWFGEMPGFGVSMPGVFFGAVIGFLTVFFASRTPTRKAAEVSPLTAVSGNADTVFAAKRAANTGRMHVETALGLHHAAGSRKNLILLTSSFAFSIILFLGFGIGVDFMKHAIKTLRPYTPDVAMISHDNACSIPDSLYAELKGMEQKGNVGIRRVYGRSFAYDLPVHMQGESKTAMLVSYEAYQFGWAESSLTQGDMESAENGEGILLVEKQGFVSEPGSEIELETDRGIQRVRVSGVLRDAPFDGGEDVGTIICSEDLFRELTGETGYTILDIQLRDRSDETVEKLRSMAGDAYSFSDSRASNRETRAVYFSFALFVYGFLAVVALIAVFHIINSVGMSVSARMRQYGAMRAIGISIRQLQSMIAAETFAYLAGGMAEGLLVGLPLHYYLYRQAVTQRWGDAWSLPVAECLIIAAVMTAAAAAAMLGPVHRIRRMSVVETIGM
ncbi:MAG: ABC transporter permease [Lachnospiraceae bacterium]|nr:ABC transporter permease [Lachnospiraceae bacterium]